MKEFKCTFEFNKKSTMRYQHKTSKNLSHILKVSNFNYNLYMKLYNDTRKVVKG